MPKAAHIKSTQLWNYSWRSGSQSTSSHQNCQQQISRRPQLFCISARDACFFNYICVQRSCQEFIQHIWRDSLHDRAECHNNHVDFTFGKEICVFELVAVALWGFYFCHLFKGNCGGQVDVCAAS